MFKTSKESERGRGASEVWVMPQRTTQLRRARRREHHAQEPDYQSWLSKVDTRTPFTGMVLNNDQATLPAAASLTECRQTSDGCALCCRIYANQRMQQQPKGSRRIGASPMSNAAAACCCPLTGGFGAMHLKSGAAATAVALFEGFGAHHPH